MGDAGAGSPVNHVASKAPPILIFHGDQDTLVPIAQSEEVAGQVVAHGMECRLIILRGQGHGFDLTDAQQRKAGEFFLKHMDR